MAKNFLRTLLMSSLLPPVSGAQPLFDAHLHYDTAHAARFTPPEIVRILEANDISFAAVSGTPPEYAMQLYQQSPDRILPILGVYRQPADKLTWHRNPQVAAQVEKELQNRHWRGVGELHLFAADRHSDVFRRIVETAVRHRVPLLVHGDPAVIDTVFEISDAATVLWAHAGTFPYPDLVGDYLARYPGLFVDLSVRDERIAPRGTIEDAWYELFVNYADRFVIGVDTYDANRWDRYTVVSNRVRQWLSQLPPDVAERLAHRNAERLFARIQ